MVLLRGSCAFAGVERLSWTSKDECNREFIRVGLLELMGAWQKVMSEIRVCFVRRLVKKNKKDLFDMILGSLE